MRGPTEGRHMATPQTITDAIVAPFQAAAEMRYSLKRI
jgi:hypothetical protein